MIKVLDVQPAGSHKLRLTFSDGSRGVADLSDLLARGGTMVEPLRDPDYFARVFLEAGAPTWPNGFDLAPWALHDRLKRSGALEAAGHPA
ncbi:DUF2442 domain-containing protein [Marinicauda salina]|uniref:DUF2442 domain-containing protein n=1 Tax=Marinicauda salina TaxID=2135793 RepID=A0A2U2BV29_9PROT|nr:DUF2442 domain-containing protein [Marinicauda salina]